VAAVKDGANKSRNISGEKLSVGGSRQWASASKGTVSGDQTVGGVDDGNATIFSGIASDMEDEQETIERRSKISEFILDVVNDEEVGLSPTQKAIVLYSYGIDPKTGGPLEWTNKETGEKNIGPMPLSVLAKVKKSGPVSGARIQQLRSKAMQKISAFMDKYGVASPEEAIKKFGLSESIKAQIAKLMIESYQEMLKIEHEMLSEHKMVLRDIDINGVSRRASFYVNRDTFEVDNVFAEGRESVLGLVSNKIIKSVIKEAKALSNLKLYSEMVHDIIRIHAQPVLAVISVYDDCQEMDCPMDEVDCPMDEVDCPEMGHPMMDEDDCPEMDGVDCPGMDEINWEEIR
jgi:hypothetical protein